MNKNILIIGPSRSGKTTLSSKLNKELGYSIISIDDIICGFQDAFPDLGIKHNANDIEVANKFAPFLSRYLKALSESSNFYNNNNQFVIEGVFIDFEQVIQVIDKNKYIIIGLLYDNITSEELYNNLKKYDNEDDWTYYCSDKELKDNIEYFLKTNNYFKEKFKEYSIKTYDVSKDRNKVLDNIVHDINTITKGE